MSCTEIAEIPLKRGLDFDNPTGEVCQNVQNILNTISEQPGCQNIWYGRPHENPNMWELVIVWDKLQSHEAFMKSDTYESFLKRVEAIMDGSAKLTHVNFTRGDLMRVVTAPAVEMLTIYHEGDVDEKSFDKTWEKFASTLEKEAEGNQGYGTVGGWLLEEMEHSNVKGKAKAYMAMIGWSSVESHMAYREMQAFKDSIPALRNDAKGLAAHHTKFEQI